MPETDVGFDSVPFPLGWKLSLTICFVFCVCSHIENWTGLQTLKDVDMELYTGLQRLWVFYLQQEGRTKMSSSLDCVTDFGGGRGNRIAVNLCVAPCCSSREMRVDSAWSTGGYSDTGANDLGFHVRCDKIPVNSPRRWQSAAVVCVAGKKDPNTSWALNKLLILHRPTLAEQPLRFA